MDQQGQRGRSPSAGHQPNHISHSPSPGPYQTNDQSIGLGVGLDQHSYAGDAFGNGSNNLNGANSYLNPQQQQAAFGQHNVSDSTLYDPSANFNQQLPVSGADPSLTFNSSQSQADYLSPNLNDGDFSLFPPSSGQGDNYHTPLFEQQTLNPNDMNNMTSPQPQHSPTPPHLLQPDGHQPGSAHQSPSFNQHQFSSPPGAQHSRNSSLAPESALMPNQLGDWTQPQFQGHRRSPSAHSDVSSVSPSPNLISADSFDIDHAGHSPLQRPSDGSLYQDVLGIESFTISDPPYSHGRSPSHSPAISPRIAPESLAGGKPSGGYMPIPGGTYGDPSTIPNMQVTSEAFPNLGVTSDQSQMAPPSINIDYAPTNAKPVAFGGIKSEIDQDSLTPPERG
jgi:transcription factor CRZ1